MPEAHQNQQKQLNGYIGFIYTYHFLFDTFERNELRNMSLIVKWGEDPDYSHSVSHCYEQFKRTLDEYNHLKYLYDRYVDNALAHIDDNPMFLAFMKNFHRNVYNFFTENHVSCDLLKPDFKPIEPIKIIQHHVEYI